MGRAKKELHLCDACGKDSEVLWSFGPYGLNMNRIDTGDYCENCFPERERLLKEQSDVNYAAKDIDS